MTYILEQLELLSQHSLHGCLQHLYPVRPQVAQGGALLLLLASSEDVRYMMEYEYDKRGQVSYQRSGFATNDHISQEESGKEET